MTMTTIGHVSLNGSQWDTLGPWGSQYPLVVIPIYMHTASACQDNGSSMGELEQRWRSMQVTMTTFGHFSLNGS